MIKPRWLTASVTSPFHYMIERWHPVPRSRWYFRGFDTAECEASTIFIRPIADYIKEPPRSALENTAMRRASPLRRFLISIFLEIGQQRRHSDIAVSPHVPHSMPANASRREVDSADDAGFRYASLFSLSILCSFLYFQREARFHYHRMLAMPSGDHNTRQSYFPDDC